jgi:hypothetical protein
VAVGFGSGDFDGDGDAAGEAFAEALGDATGCADGLTTTDGLGAASEGDGSGEGETDGLGEAEGLGDGERLGDGEGLGDRRTDGLGDGADVEARWVVMCTASVVVGNLRGVVGGRCSTGCWIGATMFVGDGAGERAGAAFCAPAPVP